LFEHIVIVWGEQWLRHCDVWCAELPRSDDVTVTSVAARRHLDFDSNRLTGL